MFTHAVGMGWGSELWGTPAAGSGIKLCVSKGVFLGDSEGAVAAGLGRAPAADGA